MPAEQRHPAWDQIEPAAKAQDDPRWPRQFVERPGEHDIELSMAISLKRIADAICGDELNTGIHRAIVEMASGNQL